jgi:dinuclear metal center YbgI/SA1388 family protein
VALDLTPSVLGEAIEWGAQLVVTHHPLLFVPLRSVSPDTPIGSCVYRLITHDIALVAMHTNLDAVSGGVSFELASKLGLEEVSMLEPLPSGLYKLVTFVPQDHVNQVREAVGRAGAGRIGDYADCAFESAGEGSFRPLEGASPFIGESAGQTERVSEVRLEVQVDRWNVRHVLTALKDAHPYEEVAYDLYPLEQGHSRFGMGAIGVLHEPMPLRVFLDRLSKALSHPAPRYAGNPDATVKTIAVCGGAGRDLVGVALRMGADVFVTADLSYHSFFDVLGPDNEPTMALVDAGHYETEAPAEGLLVRELTDRIPDVLWKRAETVTNPIRYHQKGLTK